MPNPAIETRLWDQYRAGNLDSVQAIASMLPDSSGSALFCRALFEPDGDKARQIYERIETYFSHSMAYPYAIERLKYYHAAKESKLALNYNAKLKNWPSPEFHSPNYGWDQDPIVAKDETPKTLAKNVAPPPTEQQTAGQGWSIQVGAFKNRKSAEATGRQVTRFGKVNYIDRVVEGKKLIAVQVGRYPNKYDAQRIAAQISGSTGLQTTIVRASQ